MVIISKLNEKGKGHTIQISDIETVEEQELLYEQIKKVVELYR